jgi:hypothetical protein
VVLTVPGTLHTAVLQQVMTPLVRVWQAFAVMHMLVPSVTCQMFFYPKSECVENVCTVNDWVPRGSPLDGEGDDDRSGWSGMALSSRGDVIAIGA